MSAHMSPSMKGMHSPLLVPSLAPLQSPLLSSSASPRQPATFQSPSFNATYAAGVVGDRRLTPQLQANPSPSLSGPSRLFDFTMDRLSLNEPHVGEEPRRDDGWHSETNVPEPSRGFLSNDWASPPLAPQPYQKKSSFHQMSNDSQWGVETSPLLTPTDGPVHAPHHFSPPLHHPSPHHHSTPPIHSPLLASIMALSPPHHPQASPSFNPAPLHLSTLHMVIVKLRGIPFTATEDDILEFFEGMNVIPGSVQIGVNREGRPSGEAWVGFPSMDWAQRAVNDRNNQHMGSRYIELWIQNAL